MNGDEVASGTAGSRALGTATAEIPDSEITREPRTRADSMLRKALALARRASELTDTIVVTPSTIHLRVGDSVAWFRASKIEAHDKSGAIVPNFAPVIWAERSAAIHMRGVYVVAIAPGQGFIVLRAMPPSGANPMAYERPLTRISFEVTAP
jgi:hypothetical protein